LLRILPLDVSRPYLAIADSVVRFADFRIFGASSAVHTHDQINCATRQLSLPAEFRGLNIPSFALDVEPAHNASFDATLASLITNYESESLGPLYGIIRHELHNVATSTLP
jgi:hypothetical protein